ncbi:unnamed protein product [Chondrus crispus]|uniref:Uncharacterized protein n=1 Tax=Chondrus crispus TaxID=2769 RepID=R7QDN4_CHOCR|nr:unnamed protein product [Chondrus crispus]CDF35546.1 unnamed protein product [Chondrus crispus]|eukprot:XP_005715365.1 unnamed protein product [Chondrus crispus]
MSPLAALHDALPLLSVVHEEHEEQDSCHGSCLTRWKVGFAVILLFEGLLFGHAAYFVKRLTAARAFHISMHFGNALSAGVFFAAGMLHVFPEAMELLGGGESSEIHHNERQEDDEEHDEEEGHGGHSAEFPWAALVLMLSFYFLFFVEQILIPKLSRSRPAHDDQAALKSSPVDRDVEENEVASMKKVEPENEKELVSVGFKSREFVHGLIQILGVSAHSLFESMALGLSQEFDTVLNIFIATVSHRWATSLALSFKLSRSLSYWAIIVLFLIFSGMVPFGIGIGAALSQLPEKAQGVLFAVSAGTFIYIGVYESMAEEFVQHEKWHGRKFIATLCGAGVIVVTTAILVRFDVHG